MNGVNYLLDSCFLIRWYGKYQEAFDLIKKHNLRFNNCAYSVISYVEVVGWKQATEQDDKNLRHLFSRLAKRLELNDDILEQTIDLRKTYKIKLPDALILATANFYHLQLITLDNDLAEIFEKISTQ